MPSKTIALRRTTRTRIEEARELLSRARSTMMAVNREALQIAQNKRRSPNSKRDAARRFRMSGSICSTIESLRELMWELPGVKWH